MKKFFLALASLLLCASAVFAQSHTGTTQVGTSSAGGGGSAITTGSLGPVCNAFGSTCAGTAVTPAVANWRSVTDGVCSNATPNWSSATLNLTQSDVGKLFYAYNVGNGATILTNSGSIPQFTVATVVNSTTFTSTAITGSNCGPGTNIFIGTDDAPALNSLETAIHNSASHRGVIYLPCGDYFIASALWSGSGVNDAISYWGGGSGMNASTVGCTVLHTSPAVWTISGIFESMNDSANMRDISYNGDGVKTPSAATNSTFIIWSGAARLDNMQFVNYTATTGGINQILCRQNSDNFRASDLTCRFSSGQAWQYHSLDSVIVRPEFAGCPAADLADQGESMTIGGALQALGSGTCFALSSTGGSGQIYGVHFVGTYFSGDGTAGDAIVSITKPGSFPVFVDLVNPQFDNINIASKVLLNVGTGAVVRMSGAQLNGANIGATPLITNTGTYYDGGNNYLKSDMTFSGGGSYALSCASFTAPLTAGLTPGWGTTPSPSVTAGGNACTFRINVGGGGAATTGTITLPAAPNGWNCQIVDFTTAAKTTTQTGGTATTCAVTASAAWAAQDILMVHAQPY